MSINRIVGLETEFGILDMENPSENPMSLSDLVVDTYARAHADSVAAWDFYSEDPLRDARGFRVGPQVAHPDQLTNNPVPPLSEQPAGEAITNIALRNGGRWYVDHAHPEYATPEVFDPYQAVLWDRAGEVIARETVAQLATTGRTIALYKNNVDGKGAAYGSHENYALSRRVPFLDVIRYLTPFFVSRPILCGSGRVGLGPGSQKPGFQISQRADYIEQAVGLQTTFERPIINTRDEPHAWAEKYRRLHVINGDANQFDYSTLLKVGTTNLVLWMLEQDDMPLELEALMLFEPVAATWEISHDPTLQRAVDMHDGTTRTALNIQQIYLDAVRQTLTRNGVVDQKTWDFVTLWQETLDTLKTDMFAAAPRIEWIAKYQMLDGMRRRTGAPWDNDRLRAFDVQWHDVRPEKSLVARLALQGYVERLFSDDDVARAAQQAPTNTRAFFRSQLLQNFGAEVLTLGWAGAQLATDNGPRQLTFLDPVGPDPDKVKQFFSSHPHMGAVFDMFGTDREEGNHE